MMNNFKLHFIFVLSIYTYYVNAQNTKLQNGDLLFINVDCGPMCEAINAVTQGYKDLDFNHVALVIRENEQISVIEAIGKGVVKTPILDFINRTNHPIYRGRLKPRYQNLIPQAINFSKKQLGKAYDDEFLYNNGKYYCSELVYDAFLYANNSNNFFTLYPMTYKKPNSNDFFPIWVKYFKKLNKEIPEGKLGCNPGGLSLDEKIYITLYKE